MSSPRPSSPTTSEQTPLLSRQDDEDDVSYGAQANGGTSPAVRSLEATQNTKSQRRWPSIIALTILCIAVIIAIVMGFALPAAVEEYAKEALVFEHTQLSIESFTSSGVNARIQGTLSLDASKVQKKSVRDLGRAGTWIAREVESGDAHVKVYLPEYNDVLLGTAKVPPVKFNIRNHHKNFVDILANLEPGDVDGIRRIAHDWLDRRLDTILVKAVVDVPLKSGIFSLGSKTVTQEMTFQGHDVPAIPDFDIHDLRLAEHGPLGKPDGIKAMAVVTMKNDYPVSFDIPPITVEALLPDCNDENIILGTTKTDLIHIQPNQYINVSLTGLVQKIPTRLTTTCPGSGASPLDGFLSNYLRGHEATVYVKGGQQEESTPEWIGKLLRDTIVPIPVPGHPMNNLMKNFSLANVHVSLPDPAADPDTPEASPKISAIAKVLINVPKEMNFDVDVNKFRMDADMFYRGKQLGKLNLREWQSARTTQSGHDVLVEVDIDNAPMKITDSDAFSAVVQDLIFNNTGITLSMKANVDVNSVTALGEFVMRGIPAEGLFFVKPLSGHFEMPKMYGMEVIDSTATSLTLQAKMNLTNPTEYSAHIPHVNVSVWTNGSQIGYAWLSADVQPGPNSIQAQVLFETSETGRNWLSRFISGYNTSLTVKTHKNSIPSFPDPHFELTVPAPKMVDGKFLRETTIHLLSSTASFVMVSPFPMLINSISSTATFNGTDIGFIDYEYPFALKVGENTTPRMPLDWNSEVLKYFREAIGGTLKVDAKATVDVKIGRWTETIWYEAKGIGAHIRL